MTSTNKIQIPTTSEIKGKKATMVIMNSLGLVVVRHITLIDMQLRKPYQSAFYYDLVVWLSAKGQKSVLGFRYDEIAIFEGWQPIDKTESDIAIIGECNNLNFERTKAKFENLIIEHNSKTAYCYLYAV